MSVLADDFRVETHFTVTGGSEFEAGVDEHMRRMHMRVIPWSRATSEHYDLAVSPSSNGNLHELDIPLVTLPHGAGHHKYRPTETGTTKSVSGLSREQLTHDGNVVPTVLGLSHEDQLALLRRECPEATERAAIVGDPCFDRLRAGLPLREHYRHALGIGSRRLVALSSTWGQQSLFGRQPELALRLTTALPAETHRVALILHPNVWIHHGHDQIYRWTSRARSEGLLVIPPHEGWKATLISSDVTVSDHGSLACYASALGKPLWLAEFGTDEIVPGTPMATLGDLAPRLNPNDDLRRQIDEATPVPRYHELATATFARIGHSHSALRRLLYERLDLPVPVWEARAEPVEPFTP